MISHGQTGTITSKVFCSVASQGRDTIDLSRRTGPTQSLSLRRLDLKTTIELYLLMKSSIRSVFWTLLNGLSCYFDPIELESQMHMKNIFLAPMNWNATFQKPAHSENNSEKSLHTGFCGQKRTFEVMMTKKTIGESDMNCYLRDRNENSGSIFNFAHFTSWYGLCQESYLRTCQWKRGYYFANIFHLRRTSRSANILVIDTNNSWKLYSVCMVCVDSVNVSSSNRFWLVYYNHISSITVSSTIRLEFLC